MPDSALSSPAAPAPPLHDVLIVGGGLVGASLAIALDRIGVEVGLVEAAPRGALPAVFDERNLSFAEATVNALGALGVLAKLRAPGGAIERIHVSRAGDFGRGVLEAARYGRREFGRVVVARDFGEALEARLGELARLTRYRPCRFLGLAASDGAVRAVRVADADGERTLRARLLVGADGADSAVRAALGIRAERHDYGQTLFVTRLRCARAPDGTAYERLGEHGPTALLPRGDRHYGLIHGVAADEADAVAALDEAAFLARAQHAFGWRAGRFLACGARGAYPAQRVLAARTTDARAVLVGNAAQALHPIGAQGFNLGLRDALTLAELIEQARRADPQADCGDPALLRAYAERRRDDRARTLAFSDGLARLSASPAGALRPLRSLGLFALDRLPAVQAYLVGGAMGYRGDVPALCRGEAA
ncbi:2-octaprenyl-6-methoxyphenyl hydroxylase [Vulcaniibacterium tengchongense]|uniref:2-octaprenyl-6-methoxyphenol hydroxylase /2-octaprenyl-3-methyl-6-methoxy-1,4-benzoquinol hydroxylase n=1 Tax=Vulcaniibacterium tengchongense TaxID=1273429 RepID=A0A3N4UZY7_9GAMM|nr:2-octaprenyl-6-methoxyphenyl hydroxylase [Vulcaniibacterium tengchongense]RPE75493.1 2-octaprenyl-6-methoxyphenol hydroxylase /2-octaprenyl-3-methyl-6-methoxy-1,4-benzoquinol hydroxylase [Vulcaniibacterium tengchongense]